MNERIKPDKRAFTLMLLSDINAVSIPENSADRKIRITNVIICAVGMLTSLV